MYGVFKDQQHHLINYTLVHEVLNLDIWGGFFGQLFCVNSLAPQCDDSDSRKLLNFDLDVWL